MAARKRKFDVTAGTLLGIDFFSSLDADERTVAARHCHGWCYPKGSRVIAHRDDSRDVYFIQSGCMRASLVIPTGDDLALQDLKSGEMFGELSALDGKPRSTDVEAVEETRLVQLPGESFRQLLARFPVLTEKVMLRLCGLSRYLCQRAVDTRSYSVPEQIRLEIFRAVCFHPARGDGTVLVEPAPTTVDIAKFVGTHRTQVSRVMKEYPPSVIERHRGRWVVRDLDTVTRMAPAA